MRTILPTRYARTAGLMALAGALLSGCSSSLIDGVKNEVAVTPEGAAGNPVQSLQFLASGIVATARDNHATYVRDVGIFGREMFYFQLQDGRWITGYLRDWKDNTSFGAGGNWGGAYANMRNIYNFNQTVSGAPISAQQKSAATGFAKTMEAWQLLMVLNTRWDLGIPVQTMPLPTDVAPFVSRDSAFKYISAQLDAGYAELNAGGSAFPFSLPTAGGSGFTGLSTPATFARFNRAIKARVEAYRGSLGCAACYTTAATALGQSFITSTLDAGNLNTGAYQIYSTASGDVLNGIWANRNDYYAQMSITTDADVPQSDARVTSKLVTGQGSRTLAGSEASTVRFNVYPQNTSPMPIIDNEELWLLKAEILWNTGNQAGAVDALNQVARVSGGATGDRYTGITTGTAFTNALLAERRLSLLLEGHRWIDMRRFNRLNSLPAGGSGFTVAPYQVVPQAECLYRARTGDAALVGPGC